MNDYGHWNVLKEVDILNYLGFVYVIEFSDGKKYIGAKKIWKSIKVPPSGFKTQTRRDKCEQSDWKSYTSSSNEINDLISKGINPSRYIIVGWYETWGKTLMAEMEMQLANDVLRSDVWLNKQIGGHFNPNCFSDLTSNDIERWANFEKGNQHVHYPVMYKIGQKTKYVNPKEVKTYLNNGWQFGRSNAEKTSIITVVKQFDLYDNINNEIVHVKNQKSFCEKYDVSYTHIGKLLSGHIDYIGDDRWSLHPDIRRNSYVVEDELGNKFESIQDCNKYHNFARGKVEYQLKMKTGKFKKLKSESRKDYINRLKTIDMCKTIKDVSVSAIISNTNKDIISSFETAGLCKSEMVEWLEKYIKYLKEDPFVEVMK